MWLGRRDGAETFIHVHYLNKLLSVPKHFWCVFNYFHRQMLIYYVIFGSIYSQTQRVKPKETENGGRGRRQRTLKPGRRSRARDGTAASPLGTRAGHKTPKRWRPGGGAGSVVYIDVAEAVYDRGVNGFGHEPSDVEDVACIRSKALAAARRLLNWEAIVLFLLY